ncbi:MAG TPA: sigma-54 dependent transcriptional regulator [Bacteroidota bacterium]|nr:sigma-54 dependent transcriptional regulator [Bacteroidota bacterium]
MKSAGLLPIIAQSEITRQIISRIDTIASSDSSVLLIGETGVGKELFAEYVHRTSKRNGQPLVKVGLSALPPELLESELFGHEEGAYTSASHAKKGLFELANKGSIYLDDIEDVPTQVQTKLLRVLEAREVMRVGGTESIPVDVRLITSTKVELKEHVQRGLFRADLFYRINVVPIVIPPLRHRREDIPPLVEHFLARFSPHAKITVSKEAIDALLNYSWPGNVRELRNTVQRVALFTKGEIGRADLPADITGENPVEQLLKSCAQCFTGDGMGLEGLVNCLEKNLIRHALQESNGNYAQAAKILKLSPSTLRDKLRKYDLGRPQE